MKIRLVLAVVVCCAALLFGSQAVAGEKEVLSALEKIKSGVEEGVPYEVYEKMLADVKAALDALKKEGYSNYCFINEVELSHTYYYLGMFNWMSMNKTEEEVRKQEVRDLRDAAWQRAKERLEMAYECLKPRP